MTKQTKDTVAAIDKYIRQHKWFDFYIKKYDGSKLTVAGSLTLSYDDSLEIIFEDVFFILGFFQGWHSNTDSVVFQTPENEIELNQKFEIEQGYQLFIFKTEDYNNDVIIAAKGLLFNTNIQE